MSRHSITMEEAMEILARADGKVHASRRVRGFAQEIEALREASSKAKERGL